MNIQHSSISICRTCLTSGRKMIPLNKMEHLILFAKLDLGAAGPVCWECHSLMKKFFLFKHQVIIANKHFDNYVKTNTLPTSFSKLSGFKKIGFDVQYEDGVPNVHDIEFINLSKNIKKEPDLIENDEEEVVQTEQSTDETDTKRSGIGGEKPMSNEDDIKLCDFSKHIKKETCVFENDIEEGAESEKNTDDIDANKSELDIKHNHEDLSSNEDDIKLSDLSKKIKKEQENHEEDNIKNKQNINDNSASSSLLVIKTDEHKSETKHSTGRKYTVEIVFERSQTPDSTAAKNQDSDSDNDDIQVTDKYTRVNLGEEEMLKRREKRRNEPNFKKVPYKCDSCILGFMKKESFDAHVATKHDKSGGEFMCSVCLCHYSREKVAQEHQKTHYKYYTCKICKYETCKLSRVVTHCKMKHKGDSVNKIHCKDCSNVFKTDTELRKHRRSVHPIKCDLCSETFASRANMRGHIRRSHSEKRTFTCEICQKTFTSESRLEMHIYQHGGERAQEMAYCKICRVQFKNLEVYRSHLVNTTVHPKDMYECSECHKWFASRSYLRRHHEMYHLKKSKYKCEECDKLFHRPSMLQQHRQINHGDVRSRDHECAHCEKKFFTAKVLRNHQRTHSSIRGYVCPDCGDTFKQNSALYLHVKLVHKASKQRLKKNI